MYMKSRTCEVKSHCQFTHYGQSKHLGNVICWTWLYYRPISPIPPWNCFIFHATPCNRNVHIYAYRCRKVVIEYLTYKLWYLRYGSNVSRQCSIWSVFSPFIKIENDQQQGVKSDPGLTPLIFGAGPTKMHLKRYKLALPIEKHHHQTYVFALLIEERFAWYLFDFFAVRYSILLYKDSIRDSQRQCTLNIGGSKDMLLDWT